MPDNVPPPTKSDQLRQRAEAILQQRSQVESPASADMLELIHELEVHQAELEIQNEELRQAQEEISALHREFADLYEFAPCGYLTLNPKGIITRCNLSGVTLLGVEKTRIIGAGFSRFVTSEWQDQFWAALKQSGQSREKMRVQLQLIGTDHEPLWVLADIQADQTASGEVSQWRLTLVDITAQRQAEEMRRESEARYRTLIQTALDGIWWVDLQGRLVEVNDAYCRMSGYTEQELLSMHVADLEAMESTDDIRTHIQQIVAGGSARFETRHRRQDGSIFDIEVSVQYLPAYGGRIVAFLRDITERKQAEAALKGSLVEKEVLLQEIHHRTKNNMNVICGLLTLQSSYLDDDHTRQIFQETENRIRSMALVHDKLYQSKDLSKIDFGEYITDLANSLMANYQVSKEEISLRLEVENITVNIETAMPGGLIINELITNALKYAFPAERKGTISVSLKKSTDGAIDLRVADDGIGLPPDFDMRNTTSLGMKIITNIAEIQLQGTLELHKDRGTEIRLCFHEPHYEIRI